MRRAPALRAEHLKEIEAAMRGIVRELLLARAYAVRDEHLAVLFGLPPTPH